MGPMRALVLGLGSRGALLRAEGTPKCLQSGWVLRLLVQYSRLDADIRAGSAQRHRTSLWGEKVWISWWRLRGKGRYSREI